MIDERSGQLLLQRLCHLAGVPRSSFYRAARPPASPAPDRNKVVLREIRAICEQMPGSVSPRVTTELRRRDHAVNHKRVFRLVRTAQVRCRRKRRFVGTADSEHTLRIYHRIVLDSRTNSRLLTPDTDPDQEQETYPVGEDTRLREETVSNISHSK